MSQQEIKEIKELEEFFDIDVSDELEFIASSFENELNDY